MGVTVRPTLELRVVNSVDVYSHVTQTRTSVVGRSKIQASPFTNLLTDSPLHLTPYRSITLRTTHLTPPLRPKDD